MLAPQATTPSAAGNKIFPQTATLKSRASRNLRKRSSYERMRSAGSRGPQSPAADRIEFLRRLLARKTIDKKLSPQNRRHPRCIFGSSQTIYSPMMQSVIAIYYRVSNHKAIALSSSATCKVLACSECKEAGASGTNSNERGRPTTEAAPKAYRTQTASLLHAIDRFAEAAFELLADDRHRIGLFEELGFVEFVGSEEFHDAPRILLNEIGTLRHA